MAHHPYNIYNKNLLVVLIMVRFYCTYTITLHIRLDDIIISTYIGISEWITL